MYSFYGGKPGVSYRIVQHFDSIYDMVLAFQQGGTYNTVNYGEYVIIDTIVNKNQQNNPENGIIYRRGLDYTQIFNPNGIDLNDNNTISREDLDSEGKRKYYTITYDTDGNEIIVFNSESYKSDFQAFVIEPGGGAEYVGQIVGPEGDAPELKMLSWQDFLEKYNQEGSEEIKGSVLAQPSKGAQFFNAGSEEQAPEGRYYRYQEGSDLYIDQDGTAYTGTLKDVMQYGYFNIRDKDGNMTGAYISFDIPYSVFNYHAESVDPYQDEEQGEGYGVYDEETNTWHYVDLIKEDDVSKNHPYYWQYGIKIPKGIHGQSIEEYGIERRPDDTINDGDDINQEGDNYRFYYRVRNFDRLREGVLSDRIFIDSWERSIFKITDNGDIPEYKYIKRETSYNLGDKVYIDGLPARLCLEATNEGVTAEESPEEFNNSFAFYKDKLIEDGTIIWQVILDTIKTPDLLTIHYTHGDNDEVKIRVLDDLFIDQNNGRIYVKYSDLDSLVYVGDNQSILGVEYHSTYEIEGVTYPLARICIKYNTYNYNAEGQIEINDQFGIDAEGNIIFPTTDSQGRRIKYIDEPFKFIDFVERNNDTKELIVHYSDGTATDLGVIRSIDKVFIANEQDLGKSKYLSVQYDNKTQDGTYQTANFNKQPLNQIASIQQFGDNIIVLYSDPDVREHLYNPQKDYAIANTRYIIPNFDNLTGNDDGAGNLYWINLGSAYRGNHVFGSFDSITQLRQEYPYGFGKDSSGAIIPEQIDHTGWIATVQTEDGVALYAFDYNMTPGDWYKIQDLSASILDPQWTLVVSKSSQNNKEVPPVEVDQKLNNGGYWFIISERTE